LYLSGCPIKNCAVESGVDATLPIGLMVESDVVSVIIFTADVGFSSNSVILSSCLSISSNTIFDSFEWSFANLWSRSCFILRNGSLSLFCET